MPVRMPGQAFRRRAGMLGVAGVCCSPFGPPAALRQGDHPSAGGASYAPGTLFAEGPRDAFTDDVETLVSRWLYTT